MLRVTQQIQPHINFFFQITIVQTSMDQFIYVNNIQKIKTNKNMSSSQKNSKQNLHSQSNQEWEGQHSYQSHNSSDEQSDQNQIQRNDNGDYPHHQKNMSRLHKNNGGPSGKETDNNGVQIPFIIQSYNREERQRERTNKPKLGLKRLTEDKKLVSVDIDIPIDENTVIKDKFDWDLSKDKISPSDFAKQLVTNLKLPLQYGQKIKEQILSQIMEHIKANTCQKQQERQPFPNEEQANFNKNNLRFSYNEYPEDDVMEKEENQKKKMSRMRRNEMKKTTTNFSTQPNRYFKQKKMCRNCKNQNNAPGYECKNCKLPFQLMQLLNFDDKRVKISAKYYEKIANKIPLLVYEGKKKNFEKEDFDSFYAIYNKLKSIFQQSDELSKQNLNQVKYVMQKYHQYFLNGNLDFNDQEIIYDNSKKGEKKEEDTKPKRARGRPRKIKIINDDLVPNSNQNSEQEPSESLSSSQDYSSS